MKKIKLAEALLRRKELQEKVDRLRKIDMKEAYETKTGRGAVTEGFNDMIAEVCKVSFQQFTHCFDWHARQLRMIDSYIQQQNWTCELEVEDEVMGAYVDPYVEDKKD